MISDRELLKMSDSELLTKPVLIRALAMAAKGIPVFPCWSRPGNKDIDKRPATRANQATRWGATTDPARIRRWWWINRLIGVPTGRATGTVVIDIDPRNGGEVWERWRFPQPITRVHETQSGGRHYVFAHPGGDIEIKGSSSEIAPGVDVRGDGNYVICWPAFGYRMLELPIVPLPDDLLALCQKVKAPRQINPLTITCQSPDNVHPRLRQYAEDALLNAAERVAASRQGWRNSTLNNAVWSLQDYLREGSLTQDEVTDAMAYAARAVGLDYREISSTLDSAFTAIIRGE